MKLTASDEMDEHPLVKVAEIAEATAKKKAKGTYTDLSRDDLQNRDAFIFAAAGTSSQ